MDSSILIATLAGLGGMLGWGFADFFAKKSIDRVGDMVSLAWGHIFGTALFAVLVLWQYLNAASVHFPTAASEWFILALFGLGQALVYAFVYRGFGKGHLAVLNPIFASFTGLVALFSIIVLHEAVSGTLLGGLVVIAAGIILITIDIPSLRARKLRIAVPGFTEIALATLMAATWTITWSRFVAGKDWLAYALCMYVFMTIAYLIACRVRRVRLDQVPSGTWELMILIGVGEALAYLAISWGYGATTHTSVVALLSGAFSLPTLVLSHRFLKEPISRLQVAAGFVIVLGIMLVSVL